MPQPTPQELDEAIKMAIQMREKRLDPYYVAKCLLSHNYRIKHLERVLTAADRYLNMGMAEQERTQLLHEIQMAKDLESFTSQHEMDNFGLQ
jgi:hypothetical protein